MYQSEQEEWVGGEAGYRPERFRGPVARPGMQDNQMRATPTPKPQVIAGAQRIGHAVPITVEFDALWENALDYLYVISHNMNPFEIDRVRLQTIFGEGGKIRTEVTVVPMAWVKGTYMFYLPGSPTTGTIAAGPVLPIPARLELTPTPLASSSAVTGPGGPAPGSPRLGGRTMYDVD